MQAAVSSSSGYKKGGGRFGMRKKKGKMNGSGGLGGIMSAMIPGAKVDNKGRIMVNVGTSKDTIIFNIGGSVFETYRSTLFRLPNSPLANDKFLKDHYREEKNDYFFDRDPDIFRSTLNYLRTGELHIPSYICGPAAKNELEFWGVLPNKIERCCWTNYNDWNSTLEALNQLEQDRKGNTMSLEPNPNKPKTRWNTYQPRIWNFFENPDSSVTAKIYGFISLFFVILSIFSFVAGTMNAFQTYETVPINGNSSDVVNDVTTSAPPMTSSMPSSSTMNVNTTGNGTVNATEYEFKPVKHQALHIIDIICMVFFTIEYITRLVFAPKKLKFVTSTMGVIDLVAILPDYIELLIFAIRPDILESDSTAVDFINIFHIVRVLRIFRLIKHVPGLWILVYTLKASVGELVLLTCFMCVGILMFSSMIYFAEERDNFESIPHAFWWALITMTTVGYGDMYPVTTLGKLVGSLCAMSGLLMIGFSVPALVNNFMMYYKHMQFALQAEREAKLENDIKEKEKQQNQSNQGQGDVFELEIKDGEGSTDRNDNNTVSVPLITLQVENDDAEMT